MTTAQAELFSSPFEHLDLTDPVDNLKALVKFRASLNPNEESVFYFTGNVYSFVAESTFPVTKTNKLLFRVEGFNIARIVPTADGYQQLSREILLYRDPITNEILTCWSNPLNGKMVPVIQVVNDPVNFTFLQSTWRPLATLEYAGRVIFGNDILLAFPNPLPLAVYPDYSAGNVYQAAELFNYSTNRLELDAKFVKSTSAEVSWTRIGQWLPWMQMAQAPGNLVYQARGFKLRGGFNALPASLRDYVNANYPTFKTAPTVFTTPSETSWTYFRKLFTSGQYSPVCQ